MPKKVLTVILILSLVIGCLIGVGMVSAEKTAEGWDGTVAEEFASGDGFSPETAFLIKNASQLALAVTYGPSSEGRYFKLANDIVINPDLKSNPKSWFDADCDLPADDRIFCGTFDGNGYTVSGLYYSGEGKNTGLFPIITEKTKIKNLRIANSYIEGVTYAGAVAGFLSVANTGWYVNGYSDNYPSLRYCAIAEDVTVKAKNAAAYAGLVVGNGASYVSIDNCFFAAKLEGEEHSGAEAGDYWTHGWDQWFFLTNIFSVTPFNTYRNSVKGENVYTTLSYENMPDWFTKLSETEAKGDNAQSSMPGLDFTKIWMVNENAYPSLNVFFRTETYKVSFDVSAVEGAKPIPDLEAQKGRKFTIPAAPDNCHWLIENSAVSGEVYITKDTVIKAELHSGGNATCNQKAVCTVCGSEYGEISKTHGSVSFVGKYPPSCSETGYTGDEVCDICGKLIKKGLIIPKTAHSFVDDECVECGASKSSGTIINADIEPTVPVAPPKNTTSQPESTAKPAPPSTDNSDKAVEEINSKPEENEPTVKPDNEDAKTVSDTNTENDSGTDSENVLLTVLISLSALLFVSAAAMFIIYFRNAKAYSPKQI